MEFIYAVTRVTDIKNKSVDEWKKLKELGLKENSLSNFIGTTKTFIVGDTKQVKNYSIYDWTMFDTKGKDKKHETEFPKELEKAYKLGEDMVKENQRN